MPVLVNPDLPDRSINVHEAAVPVLERSGWVRATDDQIAELAEHAEAARQAAVDLQIATTALADAVPLEPPAEPVNTDADLSASPTEGD